jgi:pSer/pThr/pTyr-binding forkhead associated (FHA) protein
MDAVTLMIVVGLVVFCSALLWMRRGQRREATNLSFAPPSAPPRPEAKPVLAKPIQRRNVLVGTEGDVKGKTFHVGMRTVTIGRSSSNFIQTLDEKASRTHCQLKPSLEGLYLNDMGSRNGTAVNEERVEAEVLLDDGDEVRVGKACFRFHRRLTVARDASMDHKNISNVASRTTMKGTVDQLATMLRKTLEECDGDIERTAAELGCDVPTIEALLRVQPPATTETELLATRADEPSDSPIDND